MPQAGDGRVFEGMFDFLEHNVLETSPQTILQCDDPGGRLKSRCGTVISKPGRRGEKSVEESERNVNTLFFMH